MEVVPAYHSHPSPVNYYYHHHSQIASPTMEHYSSLATQAASLHHHPHHHHSQTMQLNHWKQQPTSVMSQPWEGTNFGVQGSSHALEGAPVYEAEQGYVDGPMVYPSEPREQCSHYPEEKQYVSRAAAEMLLSLKQINFTDDTRHYNYPQHQLTTFEQHPDEFVHHYPSQPLSVNFQMTMSCISGVASVPNPYTRPSIPTTISVQAKSQHQHQNHFRRRHAGQHVHLHRNSACDYLETGAGDKVNICGVCRKSYARPSTLKTHMRTHSGEKPYTCNMCPKTFTQAANLTAHMRTHSGEKPFRCPVCDRRFSQSSSVTTHMRTHSGERPYRCRVCKKAFSDSSTLTKHIRIHSGEKPYQCQLCLLRFSQSGNLNRHMKVHLSERN